jgi:hypothetical protein
VAALLLATATGSARGRVVRGVQHVLSPAEFASHPETFGRGIVAGSEPLDKTLKQFLTWPYGFFVEAGAYDGLQQVCSPGVGFRV